MCERKKLYYWNRKQLFLKKVKKKKRKNKEIRWFLNTSLNRHDIPFSTVWDITLILIVCDLKNCVCFLIRTFLIRLCYITSFLPTEGKLLDFWRQIAMILFL